MFRVIAFFAPSVLWLYLMRDFVLGRIAVNMDSNTIYGVAKFYFNNLLYGVIPLWEPYVALGRPFYALAICNLFNPFALLIPVFKCIGINYAESFVLYMVIYFLAGCAGFYLLALRIFKDRCFAYLAFVALLFSSLGASMFTQFTFVEMVVPTIWFFYFLLRFASGQTKGHFLGLVFASMVLLTSYLPFYFVLVFAAFLLMAVILYAKAVQNFLADSGAFICRHWRLSWLAAIGILLAAAPLVAYKILDSSGDVVAPGRHCQYTSAQECYDRTMGREGGMTYDEITRSGGLAERLDMEYLFGNQDKISYGSDSLFFIPFWMYVLLGLCLFLRLQRLTVLLSGMGVLVGLIALGNASSVYGFLFKHISFFTYFRNLFFFGAYLLPIVILLALYQAQILLGLKIENFSRRKSIVVGTLILHGALAWFLQRYTGVPTISYITLGLSAAAFSLYFSGLLRLSFTWWAGIFTVLLILQPAWVLQKYARHAQEFASTLPSSHVHPSFVWTRPLKADVHEGRIYQFVHYEDFWYDMNMTDAPPVIGYPQSVARWTFDLSEHVPQETLANYAQYKIMLYERPSQPGVPVLADTPQLSVSYYDVNTLKLHANFSSAKRLVYNDSYTGAWKAFVDGKPVPLIRANDAFKAMDVPQGLHELEFSYHPPGGSWVVIAATLGLFSIMCTMGFMLYWRL